MYETQKTPVTDFLLHFFTYFALSFGSGNSDESQIALGITLICNPCL